MVGVKLVLSHLLSLQPGVSFLMEIDMIGEVYALGWSSGAEQALSLLEETRWGLPSSWELAEKQFDSWREAGSCCAPQSLTVLCSVLCLVPIRKPLPHCLGTSQPHKDGLAREW